MRSGRSGLVAVGVVALGVALVGSAMGQDLHIDFQPAAAPSTDTQNGYVASDGGAGAPMAMSVAGDAFELHVINGAGAGVPALTRSTGPIAGTDLDDLLRDGLMSSSNLTVRFNNLDSAVTYRVRFYLHDEAGVTDATNFEVRGVVRTTTFFSKLVSHSGPDNPTATPSTVEVDFSTLEDLGGNIRATFYFLGGPQVHLNGLDIGVAPCPADINGDGIADNGDIQAFVQLFLASDLAADFNGDGVLDNGDIGAFVAAFLAGC